MTGADGYKVSDGQPLGGSAAPYQLILEGEKRPARWVQQVVSLEVVTP